MNRTLLRLDDLIVIALRPHHLGAFDFGFHVEPTAGTLTAFRFGLATHHRPREERTNDKRAKGDDKASAPHAARSPQG